MTLSLGYEFPTPLIYAIRYDIGLGNRVQLGLSASLLMVINVVEINSMFNILKTENDSDFLSLYINPIIFNMFNYLIPFLSESYIAIFLKSGIAYEHRFGAEHNIGFYVKIGPYIPLARVFDGELGWATPESEYGIDGRVGFQTLLGEGFSITLEPWMMYFFREDARKYYGSKVAFSSAI